MTKLSSLVHYCSTGVCWRIEILRIFMKLLVYLLPVIAKLHTEVTVVPAFQTLAINL